MTAEQFLENSEAPVYRFHDGERGSFSRFVYGGSLTLTGPLDQRQREAIAQLLKDRLPGIKSGIAKGVIRSSDGSPTTIETFKLAGGGGGWKISDALKVTFSAYPAVHGHAIDWQISGPPPRSIKYKEYLDRFSAGLGARALFAVPQESGVCFPHLFVKDGGDNPPGRIVAATYRLQQHPDVTIMLEDASASAIEPGRNPKTYSAVYKSNFFWTQRYQQMKFSESLLNGSYNKVKLAGQDAVETMVRLVRDDDTEDFGYLVVARGDPNASVDTPDMMLFVVRDAKNAKKRGVAPISKEAFYALAKAIAGSVKHRNK